MQDYILESLKLQRIDFFIKLVAASECSDEEKRRYPVGVRTDRRADGENPQP